MADGNSMGGSQKKERVQSLSSSTLATVTRRGVNRDTKTQERLETSIYILFNWGWPVSVSVYHILILGEFYHEACLRMFLKASQGKS